MTSGVQFNQAKVLLVAQGSTNGTRTIAVTVVPEIITLILLADIICFQIVCFNCPTPELKKEKIKHNNTVKPTGQIGHHWSNVMPRTNWPISRNRRIFYDQKYLKKAFYTRAFYFD